jgi:type I restriction enzyme, S subunit
MVVGGGGLDFVGLHSGVELVIFPSSTTESSAFTTGKKIALPAGTVQGEITEIVGGVTVDQKRKPEDPVAVPYLRVANVQRGHIDLTEVKTIVVEGDTATRLKLLPGDILLNEGGDRDKIGRGWVWEGSVRSMIHQNHVFRARPRCEGVNPYFVSHYANEMGRRFFIEQGKQTTNLASISMTKLSQLPVPLPPPAESIEILRRVSEALAAADDAEKLLDAEASHVARLRQSILKSAFEGRLVPQDPNDEPASALLTPLASPSEAPRGRGRRRPVPAPLAGAGLGWGVEPCPGD